VPDPVLLDCVDALGWRGVVIDRMRLYGQVVTVVAAVDRPAHQQRVHQGWGPVLDRVTLASWDRIPELWPQVPPRAVRLVGALGRYRTWRQGMSGAGRLRGFCATAFLTDREPDDQALLTALWHGVGVLTRTACGGVQVRQHGLDGPAPKARYGALLRWAEEAVYRRLLVDDVLDGPDGG